MEVAGIIEHDFLLATGSMQQASHHAAKANIGNVTVPYSLKDKANACTKLWAFHGAVSIHVIAEMAGVSPTTAGKYMPPELASQPRTGKNKKTYRPKPKKQKADSNETPINATPTVQVGQSEYDAEAPPTPSPPSQVTLGTSNRPSQSKSSEPGNGQRVSQEPTEEPEDGEVDEPAETSTSYRDLAKGQQTFSLEPYATQRFSVGDTYVEIEVIVIDGGRASGYVRIVQ
jgi:hypothetical protein